MPAKNTPPGPGVDASGQAVVDPTRNVLDLVRAESKRQDDLREQTEKYADAQVRHAREMSQLRDQHVAALLTAESKRVDALRAGDQAAIQAQAAKVDATAATLAATVAAAAEAMRATQTVQSEAFTKALAEVQRFQYGLQGGTERTQTTRSNVGLVLAVFGSFATLIFLTIAVGTVFLATRT